MCCCLAAFEAAVDPSSRWQLAVLGSPFGIRAAGLRRFRSVAERAGGAKRAAPDRLWAAATLVTLVDVSMFRGHDELAAYTMPAHYVTGGHRLHSIL